MIFQRLACTALRSLSPILYGSCRYASNISGPPLNVAIIGSGPGGFYAASRLLSKQPSGTVQVDMYEKLPVPFGLARFGVAPDHPEVKFFLEKFEETGRSPYFRFIGNTMVGKFNFESEPKPGFSPNTIPLNVIKSNYDVVVFAYGAETEADLATSKTGIDGLNLSNVFSAHHFVGWYNGHPEFQHLRPRLDSGDTAIVVGHGNVALDVARILLSDPEKLNQTDIATYAVEALRKSTIKHVKIVGRRGPLQVKFTNKEVRELMQLPDVEYVPPSAEFIEILRNVKPKDRVHRRLAKQLLDGSQPAPNGMTKSKTFSIEYMLAPLEFLSSDGDGDSVGTARFAVMEFKGDPLDPNVACQRTQKTVDLPCSLACLSLGYHIEPLSGLEPFYDKSRNRMLTSGGKMEPVTPITSKKNLYASGWVHTGPRGVILDTMASAFEVADAILSEYETRGIQANSLGWKAVKKALGEPIGWKIVTWKDWLKIDEIERQRGVAAGKIREKLTTQQDILAALK